MEDYPKYLDPRTLAKLQGLELRARHIVEGYVAGFHRSPYHGFSIEFAEHREYVPGDDLRYVDWKVFAKTDKVYLKQFEEETNLLSYMVLDTSESMLYQSDAASLSKLEYAKCLAASLSYLILQQLDSVGLVTFDREIRSFVRTSSNPSHLSQLMHVMQQSSGERKTAMGPILHELADRFKKRGIVLIFSDLFDDVQTLVKGLKHLRHRRHEVVVFHILDPAELEFPFKSVTLFKGLEEFPQLLVDPHTLRKAYLQEFGEFVRVLKQACRGLKIDYVQLRTDQHFDIPISSYLARRMNRVS